MSMLSMLWNIPTECRKLNKTEQRILETLIEMKSGNTYAIWKASGLKHYPTVLRVLKKLLEKRMVQSLSQKGIRDEITYVSTDAAASLLYIVKDELGKLHRLLIDKSKHLSELAALEKKDVWDVFVARGIIEDAVTRKKQRDIDEILEDEIIGVLQDWIMNISYQDNAQKIARFARIKWMRDIITKVADGQIAEEEQHIDELRKLQQRLKRPL
jgi:hypothetical protein